AAAAPLLSYRRPQDDGTNPLRPPAAATEAAPFAAAEPFPARYAVHNASPAGASAAEPRYAIPAAATEPPTTPPATHAAPTDGSAAAPLSASAAPGGELAPATPLLEFTAPGGASTRDAAPQPASGEEAAVRRLGPPSSGRREDPASRPSRRTSLLGPALEGIKSFTSAGAGLAIVVGLLLVCVWSMRRGGAKPTGMLPEEAFAVLGRAPLTAQSYAQLLRVGNKLILVAMTAEGAQPLAEVTEPGEVDRLAGLCMAGKPSGSSAEFQQVLAQLSKEPARGFLGREASAARRRA
ncbi:MAG TPA: flagellar biosynthetic protein FliO, partial [Lacipirellulaceae bacterium]|nr:flagellar biosynthetic protein FliO [Lacipirellulaceae bacterium]